MLEGIIRRQAAEACAISIDDADLAGGLRIKYLAGVNDAPFWLVGGRES